MNNGRNRSPVGRTVFKTVRACQTGLGRFDSCFLPPTPIQSSPSRTKKPRNNEDLGKIFVQASPIHAYCIRGYMGV